MIGLKQDIDDLAFVAAKGDNPAALSCHIAHLNQSLETLDSTADPMGWARTQCALALTLKALGEARDDERCFEHAVTCFDRANQVLRDAAPVALRGVAATARAACLAHSVELTGDLALLDTAETAVRIELSTSAGGDPVDWALAQLHLARLYEARADITGADDGLRNRALIALDAALDVFSEHGCHGLSVITEDAFARVSAKVALTV